MIMLLTLGVMQASAAGCDDSKYENEPALPGAGPIGAGGAIYWGDGGGGGDEAGGKGGDELGGEGGEGGEGGAGPACTGSGKVQLRMANLIPKVGKIEFCMRAAAAPDFSGAMRLAQSLGDAQHNGLSYPEVTKSFEVDGGSWVVKAVDAAAACDAEAILETSLCLKDKEDKILLAIEGQLLSLPNAGKTEGNRLRFIHAYAGEGPLDVGLVDEGNILPPPVFSAVSFGKTAAGGVTDLGFTILDTGYLDLPKSYDSVVAVGAAVAGTSPALFTTTLDFTIKGRTSTAFAIGKKGDAAFPIKALLCEESKEEGVLAACQQF